MYIFYILSFILSPSFQVPFFCWWVVLFLKSLNKTLSGTSLQRNFLWTYLSLTFSQSVPCERKCLSATYCSFVRKWNNPQCEVSGSTVHSNTQAKPGWTERSQARALQPHPSSGLQGPNFELVKLQKALTSTMVKGLYVPARRDFCISFSLCVVCCGGFKLNPPKKKKIKKGKEGRISTPD